MQRPRLEQLEEAGLDQASLLASVAWLTLEDVPIAHDELRAARRRAVLVAASGGDPHRDLDLDSVAVVRLAEELDAPERRAALDDALAALPADGLPNATTAVEMLRSEPELAWRMFALAQVADELADE